MKWSPIIQSVSNNWKQMKVFESDNGLRKEGYRDCHILVAAADAAVEYWGLTTKMAKKCKENGMRRKMNDENGGNRNVGRGRMFASKRMCEGCFWLSCFCITTASPLAIPISTTVYQIKFSEKAVTSIGSNTQRKRPAPAGDLKNRSEPEELDSDCWSWSWSRGWYGSNRLRTRTVRYDAAARSLTSYV